SRRRVPAREPSAGTIESACTPKASRSSLKGQWAAAVAATSKISSSYFHQINRPRAVKTSHFRRWAWEQSTLGASRWARLESGACGVLLVGPAGNVTFSDVPLASPTNDSRCRACSRNFCVRPDRQELESGPTDFVTGRALSIDKHYFGPWHVGCV